jgi:hypothetical protein
MQLLNQAILQMMLDLARSLVQRLIWLRSQQQEERRAVHSYDQHLANRAHQLQVARP